MLMVDRHHHLHRQMIMEDRLHLQIIIHQDLDHRTATGVLLVMKTGECHRMAGIKGLLCL